MGKTAAYADAAPAARETVAQRFCALTNYSVAVRSDPLSARTALVRGEVNDPLVRGAVESATHILRQRWLVEESVEDGTVIFMYSRQHAAARLHDGTVVCPRCAALDEDETGAPHVGLMAHEIEGPLACEACGVACTS